MKRQLLTILLSISLAVQAVAIVAPSTPLTVQAAEGDEDGETTPKEGDAEDENSTPKEGEPEGEKTTPKEEGSEGGETTPKGGDTEGGETTPKGGDTEGGETTPKKGESEGDESTPKGGDATDEKSIPKEGDSTDEKSTPKDEEAEPEDEESSGKAACKGNDLDPIPYENDEDSEVYAAEDFLMTNDLTAEATWTRRSHLSETFQNIYDDYVAQIKKISDPEDGTNYTQLVYHLNEEENQYMDDISLAQYRKEVVQLRHALRDDYAEHFYWTSNNYQYGYSAKEQTFTLGLDVDKAYQDPNAPDEEDPVFLMPMSNYYVNKDKIVEAQAAIENAKAIAYEAKDMSLTEALRYFMDRILNLVTYDHDAAAKGPDVAGTGAWNIIYTFDMDPDTNIVCEGYAKSFKYLFEQWKAIEGNNKAAGVWVYLASGAMGNYTEEYEDPGPDTGHMWNIVHTASGYNYLVDPTNCDEKGVGYPYKLFLQLPDGAWQKTYEGEERYYAYDYKDLNTRYAYLHSNVDPEKKDYSTLYEYYDSELKIEQHIPWSQVVE